MNPPEEPVRFQGHAPGTVFVYLGATADGRQVFVPVPPGGDQVAIVAQQRAEHEARPADDPDRVTTFSAADGPARTIRLEDIKPRPAHDRAYSSAPRMWKEPPDDLEPPEPRKPIRGKAPARNARCACGSGRKYKICCRRVLHG